MKSPESSWLTCPPSKTESVQDPSAQQIWQDVYAARIDCILYSSNVTAYSLFPGLSPALQVAASSTARGQENFAYDRICLLRAGLTFPDQKIDELSLSSLEPNSSWKWRVVASERFQQISHRLYDPPNFDREILAIAAEVTDKASLQALFDIIHRSWSDVSTIKYLDDALEIALSVLLSGGRENLAVVFELEEFASYCTLRSRLNLVQSGLHGGTWLDVAVQNLSEIRASEKCVPQKIISELEKISAGQIAPLLVNEFNCVADGNHRLAASWLWNALHFASTESWVLGDKHFEERLLLFFEERVSALSRLAVFNALKGLSSILTLKDSNQRLNLLRESIEAYVVMELPVVPILSYSGFAVDRKALKDGGELRRFNPLHYQTLQKNHSTCLMAKACYHLADRLPLPMFKVIESAKSFSRIGG